MSQTNGLNRRAFLRNAGLTALAGAAAGSHAPLLAATADTAPAQATKRPSSTSTPSTADSGLIRPSSISRSVVYGKDSVQVGMGIADIDFRAAPSITNAINERVKHENWGYLDMGKWTPMLNEAIVDVEQAATTA